MLIFSKQFHYAVTFSVFDIVCREENKVCGFALTGGFFSEKRSVCSGNVISAEKEMKSKIIIRRKQLRC